MSAIENLNKNIEQVDAVFTAIKAKIAAKGIEVPDNINAEDYAAKIDEVYEAGKNTFWNNVTNGWTKTNYASAFKQWGFEYLRPPMKIRPTSSDSANQTFYGCPLLKKVEADCFDFSQKTRGTYSSSGWYYTFYNCKLLEEIEDIGMQPDYGYYTTFSVGGDGVLRTIGMIRCDENTFFSETFNYCNVLANVNFEGVIGQNINLKWSPLTADSIRSVITHLSDTASGKTLQLKKTAVESAFTDEEWATLIATKSNWTISLA